MNIREFKHLFKMNWSDLPMKKGLAILLGCLMTTIGLIILRHSHVVTGGTAGLSLSLSFLTDLPFSIVFFVINLPFYVFSLIRMGFKFTLNTVISITILSLMSSLDYYIIPFSLPVWVGSILGGCIVGLGLVVLFSHGSSLGGANILALFLQKRFGYNPGVINFLFDFCVVLISFFTIGIWSGIFSILSVIVTSVVISYYKNSIGKSMDKNVSKNYKHDSKMAVNE